MTTPTDRALALARALIANIDEWDGEPIPGLRWHKEYTAAKELIRAAEIDASRPCTCPSGDGSLHWPCPQHTAHAEAVEALPAEFRKEATRLRELGYSTSVAEANGYDMAANILERVLAARPAAVGAEEVAIVCDWSDADPFPRFIEAEINGKSVSLEWRDREDGYKELIVPVALAARPAAVGGELPEPVSYQRLFDAIGSAVHVPYPGAREISVAQFKRSLGLEKDDPIFTVCATQPQQLAVTDEAVSAFIGAIHWLRLPTHSQEEVRVGMTAALPHLARKETM